MLERRRNEVPERLQEPVNLLVAEIDHFRVVVEELLELSRAESGADPLRLEPVQLGELVRHVVRRSAPNARVRIDRAVTETPALLCDKRRIERALTNLIVNAETHGGGLERVTVARGDGCVTITVDDRGRGVPVEERERVFDRFYRGQKSGARGTDGGAGLGLALVAEHMRILGGTVRIESPPSGPGTRAVIEIPWLED